MGLRFFSQKWLEETHKLAAKDAKFAKAAGDHSAVIVTRVKGAPKGVPTVIRHEFKDGKPAKVTSGDDESLANGATFTFTADYATFVRLQKGEMTVAGAYLKGRVKLGGDISKAMFLLPALLRFNELAHKIDTEFPA